MADPKRTRGMGIRKWLTLLLILILLPLFALQGYRYYALYQEEQAEALQANLEIARAVAKSFESFVQAVLRQELAIGLAITSSTKMTPSDVNRLLETSGDYPAVRDFTWLNPEGVAIYSNNPALIGTNFSDRSFVRDVISGREWAVGELVIGKIYGKPIFGISRGIRDDKGNLLGVIFAAILPDKLDAQLAIERNKGGAISIVDQKGIMVYRFPAIDTKWEERNWLKQYPEYEDVLKGKEISKTFFATYEGKDRLASLVPISSVGWVAGAGIRKEDVTDPIIQSLVRDALLFLSVSLVALLIAAALSRKITNPLQTLRSYSHSLGNGGIPEKIKVDSVPELQDLAESFDAMAEKVQSREAALLEKEGRLRTAQSYGGVGVWSWDVRASHLVWEPELEELYGLTPGTIHSYQDWARRVHPEDFARIEVERDTALDQHMPFHLEFRIRHADGDERWMLAKGRGEYDSSGHLHRVFGVNLDITERKRAEEELRESELRFRTLAEATFEGVAVTEKGRITDVNDQFCGLSGFDRAELIGTDVSRLIHPDDRDHILANILDARESAVEHRMIRKNGSTITVEAHGKTVRHGGGDRRLSAIRDITERKRAEEALQQAHAQAKWLARLPEENPNPVMRVSADGESLYCNPAVMMLEGWKCEVGMPLPNSILPLVKKALTEDQDVAQDVDLENRMYAISVTPFSNEGYANVYGRDITDRERAEEALRTAKDELEERVTERTYELYLESLYARNLIEASLDPLVTISVEGKITDANRASEEVTGIPKEQLIGTDFSDYFTEPEKARTGYEEVFRQGFVRDYPLELKRRDGHVTPVLYNASVYRDYKGQIMGVFAAARDITERKHAEAALRKLASELVMAEQRERKRIADVLHDNIAQILAAIRMRLDLLQDMPSDQNDKQHLMEAKAFLLQTIQETRALMNELGNPLLFDLGLKSACEALADRLMETYPVRISCDIRDAYKNLNSDVKILLYQVVRELLNNVMKHSRAKNANVLIDIQNEHFRVEVADDGVGFDPQTLGVPTIEGGFGLYSIRERLITVEGSLHIESTPGSGTVVTAILPQALD